MPKTEKSCLAKLARLALQQNPTQVHCVKVVSKVVLVWMDTVVTALPDASKSELEGFNGVRMYYGVTLLSEISTADGMVISSDAWTGSR